MEIHMVHMEMSRIVICYAVEIQIKYAVVYGLIRFFYYDVNKVDNFKIFISLFIHLNPYLLTPAFWICKCFLMNG